MMDRSPKPPEVLMRAIAQDLRPVRPSPQPLHLALRMVPLALLVSPVILLAIGPRHDFGILGPLLTWGASAAQFVLAIALPVTAQSTGMVRGVVKDASGKPVEGAKVSIDADGSNRHFDTKTDKKGTVEIPVQRISHHKGFDEVRLHTEELLYPGTYAVIMEYRGDITRNMEGVYPCFFKHNGQDKKLVATQFESHHAREAFPCIDEPEAKPVRYNPYPSVRLRDPSVQLRASGGHVHTEIVF